MIKITLPRINFVVVVALFISGLLLGMWPTQTYAQSPGTPPSPQSITQASCVTPDNRGYSTATLAWTTSTGATRYHLTVHGTGGYETNLYASPYEFYPRANNSYSVEISACNDNGCSPYAKSSFFCHAYVSSPLPPQTPPPPYSAPTPNVFIEPAEATLQVGEELAIKTLFSPDCPKDMSCTTSLEEVSGSVVRSENRKVATVKVIVGCPPDENDCLQVLKVKAVSKGHTTITVRYTRGGRTFTDSMPVRVVARGSTDGDDTEPDKEEDDTTFPADDTPTYNHPIYSLQHDLYFGMMYDPDVRTLQTFLTEIELYTGPITGNFFGLTRAAVRQFQQDHDINPTGYVGPLTRAALRVVAAQVGGGDSPDSDPKPYGPGLSLEPSEATLQVGKDLTIRAMFSPCSASDKEAFCAQYRKDVSPSDVTLTSADTSIVRVVPRGGTCPPGANCLIQSFDGLTIRAIAPGRTIITARYTKSGKTYTAQMPVMVTKDPVSTGNPVSAPGPEADGTLTLEPAVATISVGQALPVKAMFTLARPACLNSVPACDLPVPTPFEVNIPLRSTDPAVAESLCSPGSGRTTCIGTNGVRGVRAGGALLIGVYTTGTKSFSAIMDVSVR